MALTFSNRPAKGKPAAGKGETPGWTNAEGGPVVEMLDALALKGVTTLAKVPLRSATKLGQHVSGTSSGSVYVCYARGSVNLALRRKANGVSLRAEPAWPAAAFSDEQARALKAAGVPPKDGTYASAHLTLPAAELDTRIRAVAVSVAAALAEYLDEVCYTPEKL